jgi:hypothetical protein
LATSQVDAQSQYALTARSGRSLTKQPQNDNSSLSDKRTMYFRYFLPDVADQVKNPEHYFRPGCKKSLQSINAAGGVLKSLQHVPELSSSRGDNKRATIQRHEIRDHEAQLVHEQLHEMATETLEGRDHGLFEAAVVDPMISHQMFFTDLHKAHRLETDADREANLKNKIDSKNIEVPFYSNTHNIDPRNTT